MFLSQKNIKHFGNIMKTVGNIFTIQKNKTTNEIYVITVHPDHNHVVFYLKGLVVFEFRDYFLPESNDRTFTRIYRNKEFHYNNGKVLLALSVVPSRVFSPKKTATKLSVKNSLHWISKH